MKVFELAEKLGVKLCVEGEDFDVESVYCGDFLSFAISKQDEKACWLTVMNNVNVMGVASLCETSMIILCDGTSPDENMSKRAEMMGVSIFSTEKSVYQIAVAISAFGI